MKAVLVIDEMPKNCAECRIRLSGEPNEWCWYIKHGLDDIKTKPSWCPLKPLPQKQTLAEGLFDEEGQIVMRAYFNGYNACIEEIEDD